MLKSKGGWDEVNRNWAIAYATFSVSFLFLFMSLFIKIFPLPLFEIIGSPTSSLKISVLTIVFVIGAPILWIVVFIKNREL